jgi:hypothetical protein
LKPGRWGSLLVQENNQEEKARDKRLIIIIIIIIKGDTSNNWSDWNHFKIIQKIREHHTRKS